MGSLLLVESMLISTKHIVPQKYFTLNTVLKQNWPFQQPAFQYSLHTKEKGKLPRKTEPISDTNQKKNI